MATVIKKGTSKKEVNERIQKVGKPTKYSELSQLAGKLSSKIEPMDYQHKVRNEWK
jgi:hypothetical protein